MRYAQVFNRQSLGLALLVVIAFTVYNLVHFSPFEQSIIRKLEVNNLATLYITRGSAGATTHYSYRYYLFDASKSEVEVKEIITNEDTHPFLITDDHKVQVHVKDNSLYITLKGTIYNYQSPAYYRTKISVFSVPVYLTASPW